MLDDVFRRHFRRKMVALPVLCTVAVEGALRLVKEERHGKARCWGRGCESSWVKTYIQLGVFTDDVVMKWAAEAKGKV